MDTDKDPLTQFFTPTELSSNPDILYHTLSIEKTTPQDDIKKAYRRAALKWHPDKHSSKTDQEKEVARVEFLKVGFAFEVLGEDSRRKT